MSGVTFPGQCPPGLVYSDADQRCRHLLPSEMGRCGRSVLDFKPGTLTSQPPTPNTIGKTGNDKFTRKRSRV
ncbi:hypothetical protein PoB_002295900 [Plakobranchus ocellatus]|uniref:Chitin-binding type-2 domain-containing protein n=1 Tax=Plakobranchus ocellatus TaxID=259542 RepID=A0AAV3ZQ05_9GAST|nr:hypothetical protein PoB_002295900 [Plakobranchus ocellatus]